MAEFEFQVISFYKFHPIAAGSIRDIESDLLNLSRSFDIRGLFILGTEGVNSTFSVAREQADAAKRAIGVILNLGAFQYKDSFAPSHPFHELKVKVRDEIVTLARPDLHPSQVSHHHLTPEEWQKAMNEEDVVVIDTRNSYEYDIGHFRNAINPNTREFTQFPEWLKRSGIAKDQKVLIYCTGGIRCEKAILEMEEEGYSNVHQLDGGILNYLQKFPRRDFEGECFVFDYRVAVDQDLAPTRNYRLCPHCGQPAKEQIQCIQCGTSTVVCKSCLELDDAEGALKGEHHTCTKNCAHHFRMGHKSRRPHHDGIRWQQQ